MVAVYGSYYCGSCCDGICYNWTIYFVWHFSSNETACDFFRFSNYCDDEGKNGFFFELVEFDKKISADSSMCEYNSDGTLSENTVFDDNK